MPMVTASEASDMEPRSAKGRRTRAKLIKAAKEVFERDGFLNARIADISETAGMSHGSFYHYFESKEQVFRELAGAQEVSVLDMHEAGAPADQSPVDRIRAGNRRYLESYKREARLMRVIEEVSRYDDDVLVIRVQRQQEFAQKLQASIIRLQKEGLADKSIDPHYAANALGGMVAKFAEMWFGQNGRYSMDKAVDQLTLLWANALGLPALKPAGKRRR
jgi:AcrR family transcriptional regulator